MILVGLSVIAWAVVIYLIATASTGLDRDRDL